jgi:hypothetical protein
MIQTASKYSDPRKAIQTAGRRGLQARRSPAIFIPNLTGKKQCLEDWYYKELKDGNFLSEYLTSEKHRMPHLIRKVARMMHGFEQNPNSDFRRRCTLPARLVHRWKAEDKDFFEDDSNLRSLKRDNPDLAIFIGQRRMPSTAERTVYPANNGDRRDACPTL